MFRRKRILKLLRLLLRPLAQELPIPLQDLNYCSKLAHFTTLLSMPIRLTPTLFLLMCTIKCSMIILLTESVSLLDLLILILRSRKPSWMRLSSNKLSLSIRLSPSQRLLLNLMRLLKSFSMKNLLKQLSSKDPLMFQRFKRLQQLRQSLRLKLNKSLQLRRLLK